MNRTWGRRLGEGNAAMQFAPAEGTGFFEFRSGKIVRQRNDDGLRPLADPGALQPAPPNRMPRPSSMPVSELEAPSLSFTLP